MNAVEQPIWIIVLAGLELDHPLRVLPDMESNDVAGRAVVSPVEALLRVVRRFLISLQELLEAVGVAESANGLGQISERIGLLRIQHIGLVVLQDPRHDWVLRQVLEASLGKRVQNHQVVKIADLLIGPLLRVDADVLVACEAFAVQIAISDYFQDSLVCLISLLFVLEHHVEGFLVWIGHEGLVDAVRVLDIVHVERLLSDYFQANILVRESSLQELGDSVNPQIERRLIKCGRMHWLKVDPLLCDADRAVDCHQGRYQVDPALNLSHVVVCLEVGEVELGILQVLRKGKSLIDKRAQIVLEETVFLGFGSEHGDGLNDLHDVLMLNIEEELEVGRVLIVPQLDRRGIFGFM